MEEMKEFLKMQVEGEEPKQQLWLPKLLGEGCVLQQGENTRIWGKSAPYLGVTVEFQENGVFGRADAEGDWQVILSDIRPGGPYPLSVKSESGEILTLQEVFVGEVFVCAGQSNMELPMERVKDRYPEEFERPGEPYLRLYKVREQYDYDKPLTDHGEACWQGFSKETVSGFSAVSYFFGRYLLEARKVPVGLINLSLGGCPAEAFMGRDALLSYPEALETLEKYRNKEFVREQMEWSDKLQKEWHDKIDQQDIGGINGGGPWKKISLPGFLSNEGIRDFCGCIWLRKKFYATDAMAGKAAKLWLGTLVDSDKTYINGVLVGETFYQYPPRKYEIPERLLKSGENEILIRLTCDHGAGRVTPGKIYEVFTEDERICLEGEWEYRIGFLCGPAPEMDFVSRKPTGLYNAFVAPCLLYTVKGVLWYQGESNDKNPGIYKDLLQGLISYWREQWGQEKLPFVVAQLPGFSIDLQEDLKAWPMIREAQAKAALLPDVAVTVNLDLGEWNDLHPLNKKEVARRMALAVRGMIYEEPVVWKGPEVHSWEVIGNCVRVSFKTGDGKKMEVRSGIGTEAFRMAGADGIFYPVEGQTEDDTVSLWSKEVDKPEFLTYGYENAPEIGLLFNQEGLPASPFCLERKDLYGWGTHLFNDQWFFFKESLHKMLDEFPAVTGFHEVGLPYDWLIEQGNDLYEDSRGWYRKCIYVRPEADRVVFLRFDGVYMDSTIYVNRQKAGEWKYGYSCFEVDMTPWLKDGENEILVRVNHQSPNGRWYSGAGIYRDVWLKVLHGDRLISDGLYAAACKKEDGSWELKISAEVQALSGGTLHFYLNDRDRKSGGEDQFLSECRVEAEQGIQTVTATVSVTGVKLWDIINPFCYELRAELFHNREKLQEECLTIGFRTIEFDPDRGFLLNGIKVKLNGVCEHHDLGCLGAAYHSQAMERKFSILKYMGVNAVRISHNMPAQDVMELADKMGILIVSEAFDMWERSKTPYDYARFFPEWYQKDVASWVRRDRSHPSLIMWSIGNEIYDTHVDRRGQEVTMLLMDEVKKHDPWGNARVTIASNYMPWENARKCADLVKLAGYNYGEKYYEEHHKEHPDWIIYGSETASTVQSRGIYHFPYGQSVLADEDEQCSALGNSTTSWGAKSSESCIIAERDHEFSCGQFLWTGFDYIGEPTPYHTRNSYFGQVDTAGFPKDSYYLYQAEWTDYREAPMVHVFPYWDFNDGQMIDVRICSNAPVVELFLNGKSQGKRTIDHKNGDRLTGDYVIPYEKGRIHALAYDESGNVIAEDQRNSFGESVKIRLEGDKKSLKANGEDLLFVTVSMEDEKGNPVENANNRVFVTVTGNGDLVGLDNGDSTDQEEYKGCSRRLFSGKLLLVAAAGTEQGELTITVTSPGLRESVLRVPVFQSCKREGVSSLAYRVSRKSLEQGISKDCLTDIPVRNMKLISEPGTKFTKDQQTAVVTAGICPPQALDQTLMWSVVNDKGIPSKLAVLDTRGNQATITAKSDGKFRLRCMSRSGTEKIRILSTLEFSVEGIGETFLNPYEFISAGLYDYSAGEVGNGNEKGVSTARDGETQVGFHNLNFGSSGSDEIIIPIFALTDEPYRIRIYEGMPGEEQGRLLADEIYQKPSIWNVYQEETFHLSQKLRGVTSLCMVLEKKVHIKGFSFVRKSRGYDRLPVTECDEVYGDHFRKEKEGIREIGNNVTIVFRDMEFGEDGADGIQICGYTPNDTNSILVRFVGPDGQAGQEQMFEFKHMEELDIQFFPMNSVAGTMTVEYVFLPGSHFDFCWFQFVSQEKTNRNM